MSKTCNKCKKIVQLANFYNDRSKIDGKQVVCAECQRIKRREIAEQKRLKKDVDNSIKCLKCDLLRPIASYYTINSNGICKICTSNRDLTNFYSDKMNMSHEEFRERMQPLEKKHKKYLELYMRINNEMIMLSDEMAQLRHIYKDDK